MTLVIHMPKVYLGIGSNMGNRDEHIRQALHYIEEESMTILKQSSVIETDPVGGPPQGKFLNLVIEIETSLKPHDLLHTLKNIEHKLGRVKTIQDGPRPIDLDILLYDNKTLTTPELTIPHPRMFQRSFVMTPLKEIAPQLIQQWQGQQ